MKTEKTKEIVVIEKKINKALQDVASLKIVDDHSMLEAGEFRKVIKTIAKNAKEEKEKVTKPMNDVLKTVRGWFAPIEENCDKIISIVEMKMEEYQEKVNEKRIKAEEEAQRKIEEAEKLLAKGKISEKEAEKVIEKVETKLEKAPEVITKSDSFHTRVDRKIKFSDPIHLSIDDVRYLVGGKYLVWDEVKGRRDALSGVLTVGVEIYEQKSFI